MIFSAETPVFRPRRKPRSLPSLGTAGLAGTKLSGLHVCGAGVRPAVVGQAVGGEAETLSGDRENLCRSRRRDVNIVNAERVAVAESKMGRLIHQHSGYPGGLRRRTVGEMLEKHADRVVERAVRGMLPHTRLGRAQFGKLKVYPGPDHPHAAQQPAPFQIRQVAQW